MATEENYDDIRPYRDDEVPQVLQRLKNSKWLMSGLRTVFLSKTPRIFAPLVDRIIKSYLSMKLGNTQTVDAFQRKIIVDTLLHPIVKKTSSGLSYSGIENLDPKQNYLFVSNHRDIVLDPALLDYILTKNGFEMAQVAFGDNLLINDVISDLIRINRGVIVKRNLPPRDQYAASMKLSNYIRKTLDSGESIWIAQSSGRSKDGMDITNPAIMKMLFFAYKRDKIDFHEFLRQTKIVPIAISYQYDPCDRMKAWEIHRKRTRGEHKKRKYEDLVSIMAGIKGFKGKVHYHFNAPMEPVYNNEKELVAAIDERIQHGYKLWSTNFIAYDVIHNTNLFETTYSEFEKQRFFLRFHRLSKQVRTILLEAYANPVANKMMHGKKIQTI